MDRQSINIGELISEGWKLTKANLSFLVAYLVILFFLTLLFSGSFFSSNSKFISAIFHLLGWGILFLTKMGLYNSALLITSGVTPRFDQLYSNWPHFISWVVASFLFGLMFAIGIILLVIPGCYVLAKYGLFPFFILDRDLGPLEALKEAGKVSEGRLWSLFLLFLSCFALNMGGFLLLGLGLLVTIPITVLALALAYRKITGSALIITENSSIEK